MRNGSRRILDPMVRRLAALLVALAVTTAPVALEACEIACGSGPSAPHAMHVSAAHRMAHGAQPSCHEAGNIAAERWAPGPPPCSQAGTLASFSAVTTRAVPVVPALLRAFGSDSSDTVRGAFDVRGRAALALARLEPPRSLPLRI